MSLFRWCRARVQVVSPDFVAPPPAAPVDPTPTVTWTYHPDLDDDLICDTTWEASIRRDERRKIAHQVHATRFDGTKFHATPDTFYAGTLAAIRTINPDLGPEHTT